MPKKTVSITVAGHKFQFKYNTLDELRPIVTELAQRTDVPEFDWSAAYQVLFQAGAKK